MCILLMYGSCSGSIKKLNMDTVHVSENGNLGDEFVENERRTRFRSMILPEFFVISKYLLLCLHFDVQSKKQHLNKLRLY